MGNKTRRVAHALKLTREFYERSTLTVARELLGKLLVHALPEGTTTGKIVEVEAYMGPGDAAAHTYKGLRSSRTEVAFGPGGHAYVYMIYGMYHCFNIVTNMGLHQHPCHVLKSEYSVLKKIYTFRIKNIYTFINS